MSPEGSSELKLYQEWAEALDSFWERLELEPTSRKKAGLSSQVRDYRQRVGQDLTGFQEKLSSLMGGEEDGQ